LEFIFKQMKKKALIISIKGKSLSRKERLLLSNEKPWGIILFKRNLKSFNQIKTLTKKIRTLTRDRYFPIIIDEEGKGVSRLSGIINHNFSANFFGRLFDKNKILCKKLLKHYVYAISKTLKELGFNINTIPVLDVLRNNTHKIIGNRSFSKDPKIIKVLGLLVIKYLHLNKICGVVKHVPGHGAATADSHKKTPKVHLNLKDLNKVDFYPFKSSKSKFAMTAHILFPNIDKKNVATFSKKIITKIIRKKLGFKGILISDDISMKALKYNLVTNAKKSLEAGCNIVLYCSGNINDNLKLIKSLPYIDKFTSKKTSEFYNLLR